MSHEWIKGSISCFLTIAYHIPDNRKSHFWLVVKPVAFMGNLILHVVSSVNFYSSGIHAISDFLLPKNHVCGSLSHEDLWVWQYICGYIWIICDFGGERSLDERIKYHTYMDWISELFMWSRKFYVGVYFCTQTVCYGRIYIIRADSRFAPSQWKTALLCNNVSHWLGTNLESALIMLILA